MTGRTQSSVIMLCAAVLAMGVSAAFWAAEGPEYTDERTAAELQQAAEGGEARAMVVLGWRHFNGVGVDQDDEVAVGWFRKAADKGNARGMLRLGWAHQTGRGVAQDKEEMARWELKAAQQVLPIRNFTWAAGR